MKEESCSLLLLVLQGHQNYNTYYEVYSGVMHVYLANHIVFYAPPLAEFLLNCMHVVRACKSVGTLDGDVRPLSVISNKERFSSIELECISHLSKRQTRLDLKLLTGAEDVNVLRSTWTLSDLRNVFLSEP